MTRRQLWNSLVLFGLFNSLVALGICWRYLKFFPQTEDPLARLFTWVAYITHSLSIGYILVPVVGILVVILPFRRLIASLLIVLYSAIAVLLIVDSFVFADYRFHLNSMVWNLLTGGAVGEILPLSVQTMLLSFLIIAGIIGLEALVAWGLFRPAFAQDLRAGTGIFVLVLAMILAGQLFYAWADARGEVLITRQVRYLPAYKPLTMDRTLRKLGIDLKKVQTPELTYQQSTSLAYPQIPLVFEPTREPLPHVLVIVVDSLRFDLLNAVNTPTLNRLREQSWEFTNHYSSGNSTRFGIFGLFYGIYATYWHAVLAEMQSPLLMRAFVENGYQFAIHASAPLSSPEFDRTVFADLREQIELKQSASRVAERDREITDKMIHSLKQRDKSRPLMGFLFYDAPHAGDYPPAYERFTPALKTVNHLDLNNSYDATAYFNRFRNAVYYCDALIGEVVQTLKEQGMLENTVLIVTGDHGEEFNELKNNYWGHNGSFSRYQVRVPLLIRWPGEKGKTFENMSSHLDLAPTLMRKIFAVANDPQDYSNGRELTDSTPRDFVLASNWTNFAMIEPDQTTVVFPAGQMETYRNEDYRLLDDKTLPAGLATQVMQNMSRFLTR